MLRPIVSSVLLFLFLITTCSNAEQCFCPVREDAIIYHEPSLSAAKEGVVDDKQIIKGSYIGEWIRLEGENIMFALLEDFTVCECPGAGKRFDCINNSCNQRARRQINAVAFWNTWQEWSSCSLTCGLGGIHFRKRECQQNGVLVNITNCPGSAREFKKCGELPECDKPEETVWGDWGTWSACSQTCDAGFRQRVRHCTRNCPPLPQIEKSTCFDNGCNVTWTQWHDWNDCSKTCGGGLCIRYRECTDGEKTMNSDECPYANTNPKGFYEIKVCNSISCELSEWSEWSDWSEWTECTSVQPTSTCGKGISFRYHSCVLSKPLICPTNNFDHRPCYIPCPGRWSDWENWSQCDLTCGNGTQSRARDCNTTASVDDYMDLNCTGDDFQTMSCNTAKCPVDGQFSDWSNWTECSETCGGGRQQRSRACDNPAPAYGGQYCLGDETEQRECSVEICPRDGGWSNWDIWSECSQTCGTGIHIRERHCNNPFPLGNGLNCNGSHQHTDFCLLQPCAVDGGWTDWTPWSACSCENTTFRRRECTNPAPVGGGQDCIGEAVKNSICTHQGTECPVNGEWAGWIPWGRCSVTCDQGIEQRFRTCTNPRPSNGGEYCFGNESISRSCMEIHCPVNGGWSDWGSWSECSVTCENGTRVRNRTCDNPAPEFHGDDCVGNNQETDLCLTNRMCPIDGDWADWSSWSDCPETCNNGTLIRSRNCSNPEPQYGGKICTGKATETRICFQVDCPAKTIRTTDRVSNHESRSLHSIVNWENWSSCSRTCDGGNRTRTRTCSSPTPSYGGLNCSGPEIENEFCYLQSCKINGSWNTWEEWTPCSVTCSNGTRQRIRLCDHPPPSNGGSYCNGSFIENGDCFRYCPQNGAWASWLSWNNCSVTCGYGTGFRTRTCSNPFPLYGGKSCTGSNKDTGTCFLMECPVDGVWAEWSQWSSCSVTCSSGTEHRTRNCTEPLYGGQDCPGNDTEDRTCDKGPCPIDGEWQNWEGWSPCSVTCGHGNSTRLRNCTVPQFGGSNCTGNGIELIDCFPVVCPIDGNWGDWYPWNHCTVTCETGTKARARVCVNPPPQFGGAYCQGPGRQNVTCDMGSCDATSTTTDATSTPNTGHTTHAHGSTAISTPPAVTVHTTPPATMQAITTSFTVIAQTFCDDDPDGDCHIPSILQFVCQHNDTAEKYCKRSCGLCPKVNGGWSDWGSWSPCSVTCENGTHVRNRTCDNPAPKFGGDDCVGSNEEAEDCDTMTCPTPCADLLDIECGKPNLLAFICQHNNIADHYCKRSCGRCPTFSPLEANPRAVLKKDLSSDCPRVRAPMNSLVSDYTTTVGSVMTIKCLQGFRLEGPGFRICLSDGSWSGTDVVCQNLN